MDALSAAVDAGQWDGVVALLRADVPAGTVLSQRVPLLTAALKAQLSHQDLAGTVSTTRMLEPRDWIPVYGQVACDTPEVAHFVIERLQIPSGPQDALNMRMGALVGIAMKQPRELGGRLMVESLQRLATQSDDRWIPDMSRQAAIGLAQLGYSAGAIDIAGAGTDDVWEAIAIAQANAGRVDDGLKTAERMSGARATSLRLQLLLQAGREAEAAGVSEHWDSAWERLVTAAWYGGREAEADRYASKIQDPDWRARMQVLTRGFLEGPGAVRELLAKLGPSPFIAGLAVPLARKGALDSALVLLESVEKPHRSNLGWTEVFDGLCRSGRLEQAFEILQNREVPRSSSTYATFGTALVRDGQTDRAVELALHLPSSMRWALSSMVGELLRQNQLEAAKQLLPPFSGHLDLIANLAAEIIGVHPQHAAALLALLL